MTEYVPSSPRGRQLQDEGYAPEVIQELETTQQEIGRLRAQMFLERHPEAGRPEVAAKIMELGQRSSQDPIAAMEVLYAAARNEPGPPSPAQGQVPPAGARRLGAAYDPGVDPFAQQDERRTRARQVYEQSGSMVQAARSIGYRVHHPDFDNS